MTGISVFRIVGLCFFPVSLLLKNNSSQRYQHGPARDIGDGDFGPGSEEGEHLREDDGVLRGMDIPLREGVIADG